MSNPESFIDEVTEELRRDKLFAQFRRYGWIAVLTIVLIVGGVSYNEWRKAQDTAAAQALGDAVMAALDANDPAQRVTALQKIDATGEAGALVALLAAGEAINAEDTDTAIAAFQSVASNDTYPQVYRQLATLKMVMAQGDSVPVATRRASLEPLTQPGAPYRPLALEQMALLSAEDGDNAGAIKQLRDLTQDSEATAGLRQRATQLIVALGGTLDDA